MKAKIVYTVLIGLCFMLSSMQSSAQSCNQNITADAWTLYIADNASGYTYTCSGQVWNSTGFCYSNVYDYGTVLKGPTGNLMPQNTYRNNYEYNNGPTYWLHVVVYRSDGASRTVSSTAQPPDQNYHISPGTLRVTFN